MVRIALFNEKDADFDAIRGGTADAIEVAALWTASMPSGTRCARP